MQIMLFAMLLPLLFGCFFICSEAMLVPPPFPQAKLDCAKLPPALWCASGEVQNQCGTGKLCQLHANATAHRSLKLTVFYESLCPASQQFIVEQLFPAYKRFGQHVAVELVPFGNSQFIWNNSAGKKSATGKTIRSGGNMTSFPNMTCQHGNEECELNKFQSCAIAHIADPMPFIACMEHWLMHHKLCRGIRGTAAGDRRLHFGCFAGGAKNVASSEMAQHCFKQSDVLSVHTMRRIEQCHRGTQWMHLQQLAAVETARAQPNKHTYVPWILINGVSLGSQQFYRNALPALICHAMGLQAIHVKECMDAQ